MAGTGYDTYRYKAIEEEHGIRLLELHPANYGEPLRCHVISTTLDASPSYQAVSYTWGSPDRTHTIELGDSYLNITFNLHEVLNRFRELTKPRLLWVDAICIDQQNIPERNRQVALMGRIYMQAAEVLIYLGQEQYESEKVPALLKDIREVAPLLDAEKVDIRASKFALTDYGLPPQDDKRWLPVVLLWIRPWFGRLWVMQECVLAARPIIHCGSWAANWDEIFPFSFRPFDAISFAHNDTLTAMEQKIIADAGSHGYKTMSRLRCWRREGQAANSAQKAHLAYLLETNTSAQCSDPRDKLFGLLSIAVDGQDPEFAPDYSLSPKQLSLKYSKHILRGAKPFSILSKVCAHTADDDLPSWCPNLTELAPVFKIACTIYDASDGQPADVIVSETTNLITVHGYLVDEIIALVASSCYGMSDGGPTTWLAEIDALMAKFLPRRPHQVLATDAEAEERKWRFLIGNRTLDDTLATSKMSHLYTAYTDMGDYARAWSSDSPVPTWTADLTETEMWEKTREATLFETGVSIMKHGRRVAVTETGRLAWIPEHSEIGDAICILSGWRAPFVLKRTGGDSWKLLGEAYVQGIMGGEAMRDGTGLVQQDFRIV